MDLPPALREWAISALLGDWADQPPLVCGDLGIGDPALLDLVERDRVGIPYWSPSACRSLSG